MRIMQGKPTRRAHLVVVTSLLSNAVVGAVAQIDVSSLEQRLAPSPTPASAFVPGAGGYTMFCSPSLASNAAALIVVASAFTGELDCNAAVASSARDIVLTRSTDAGQSFAPLLVIATAASVYGADCAACVLSDATPVGLAIDSNAPLLLFATGAHSAAARDAGVLDVLLWRSTDSGVTWSTMPENLTAALGGPPMPRLAGTHGIKIQNAKYAGRLAVPATRTYGATAPAATAFISDDSGATWRRSAGETQGGKHGGFAELSWETPQPRVEPGTLVAYLQDDVTPCGTGMPPRCRWLAYSVDGGDTWGGVTESDSDGGSGGSISQWWVGRGLLTVNARSPGGNLTLFASQDGGEGGTGNEVIAREGGSADVLNFIWLAVAEFAAVAWESPGGGVVVVVVDPSTLIGALSPSQM